MEVLFIVQLLPLHHLKVVEPERLGDEKPSRSPRHLSTWALTRPRNEGEVCTVVIVGECGIVFRMVR
jgi:hypothetical protein